MVTPLDNPFVQSINRADAVGPTTSASSVAYTVTFTEDGFDTANSTIAGLPDINPMGT